MKPDPRRVLTQTVFKRATDTAVQRGGQCLSSPGAVLANPREISWRCALGHHFTLSWDQVHRRGEWCSVCMPLAARRSSLGERVVRAYCQQLFGAAFPRVRPGWVTELDGYCETLGLAYEHHGAQHYRYVPHWHRTPEGYADQQRRDHEKEEVCRRLGVVLIVVPDLFIRTREEDLRGLIKAACVAQGRAELLPADFDTRAVDLRAAYSPDPDQRLEELRAEAQAAGSRVEEGGWLGDGYRYHFACLTPGCGRTWRSTATRFLHKRQRQGEPAGCASCSAKRGAAAQRKDFAAIVAAARAKGITVLTTPEDLYARPDARAELQCERCASAGQPFTWSVPRAVITKGIYGCHRCARKVQLTGEDIFARVQARGWRVMALPSAELAGNRARVKVSCGRGHAFEKAVRALEFSGCPECYRPARGGNSTRRLTQALAEAAARALGWRLLSTYTHSKAKLRYACLRCHAEVARSHNGLGASPCPGCGHHGDGGDPSPGTAPGSAG